MFCRNCGTNLADDAAFCANCGQPTQASGGGAVATATDPGASGAGAPGPTTFSDVTGGGDDQLLALVKQELGKDYRIEKELGRGGMAIVYKGVETALERVVAIKVVPPESANAGQAAERFRREARLAASLDHANIIPVYRVGQAGPLHFMAMKFVEGRAVDAIIEQQGALPVNIAVAILKYSALGLAFAHEKKIVHRDIKGANILVDKDGRVMVSDFGIARALEEVSLTASGMMIGTPYFMSPEQCGGQKVSPQSDQYSLGILAFQLLTGELPFVADSMVGVIQHHYMTPVPDITQVRTDVPKELMDVVYCALNKDPADRFLTTKDMALALENVPLTDAQREEAEVLLKQLSAGQSIPKVRTGSLPPLTLTVSGPSPKVQIRPATTPRARPAATAAAPVKKKKKKNRRAMKQGAAVLGFVVIAGGWLGYSEYSKQQRDRQRVADSVRLAAEADSARRAQATAPGTIVFTGLPPGATLMMNNKPWTNGVADTTSPGTAYAQVRATNYQDLLLPVTVRPGRTDTVPVSMQPATATSVAQAPGGRPTVSPPAESVYVRFNVTPLRAKVFIDDVEKGEGRVRTKVAIGTHVVRFDAVGCNAEQQTIQAAKGPEQVIQKTLPGCQ